MTPTQRAEWQRIEEPSQFSPVVMGGAESERGILSVRAASGGMPTGVVAAIVAPSAVRVGTALPTLSLSQELAGAFEVARLVLLNDPACEVKRAHLYACALQLAHATVPEILSTIPASAVAEAA